MTIQEKMLLQILLDPPDILFPPGIGFFDVPPRRFVDFVRLTGLPVETVSDALDSLVAKSVLDVRHGPGDYITLGQEEPENAIGGVWYGIRDTPEAKIACKEAL